MTNLEPTEYLKTDSPPAYTQFDMGSIGSRLTEAAKCTDSYFAALMDKIEATQKRLLIIETLCTIVFGTILMYILCPSRGVDLTSSFVFFCNICMVCAAVGGLLLNNNKNPLNVLPMMSWQCYSAVVSGCIPFYLLNTYQEFFFTVPTFVLGHTVVLFVVFFFIKLHCFITSMIIFKDCLEYQKALIQRAYVIHAARKNAETKPKKEMPSADTKKIMDLV